MRLMYLCIERSLINYFAGFFPLAMGIVSHENESNWSWFLSHLKEMLNEDRSLVFMSDRHWGLLLGVPKVFPSSYHSYCLLHMEQNIGSVVKAAKGDSSVVELFKLCARASNMYDFERYLSKFKNIGGMAAENFLQDKPFDHWADLFFQGKRYGEYTSNVAESFNSWILEDRVMPITSCLDGIRVKVMEQMARRREECRLWTTTLCPVMEERLSKLVDVGFGWDVYKSSDFVFEVKSPKSHFVDLENHLCSCNQWRITGFPCAHAIKCINKSRLSVYDYVEHYFTVDAFRSSYAEAINPIPNFDKPVIAENDVIIRPPKEVRGAGRPSTKRRGGYGYSQNKRNKCSQCNSTGHNKRNCEASSIR